ncbi:MAG: arylamine N-acetyltransferase [Alphaproteobacteria bacterium]|nr:arylamine N-acetyltransferase [Alphaproteobacteria bacterium]
MTASFDLDAYLKRIGWSGTIAPNLATLTGLLGAHMAAIPFENLDVLLRRPVRLDLDGLQAKLVGARRGGYCFEHVTLFAAALRRLGFEPIAHTARVTRFLPRTDAPRTHMILVLPMPEGRFVVDPGLGGFAPRVPVPLTDGLAVTVHGEMHRMVRDGDWWVLQVESGGEMVDAWASTLDHDNPVDFEVGNHFTSTHPKSPFLNMILMRALTPEGRVTVMNRDVTVWRNGTAQPAKLADRAALRALLAEHFGFDLPEVEQMSVPAIPEWA